MSIAKRFAASRTCLGICVAAFILTASNQARAGVIVSGHDDSGGISASDDRSSSFDEHSQSADGQLNAPGDFALPTDGGSTTNTTSTTTSSSSGVSAILPQTCGCSLSAFSAGLCEERSLRLPPSPFFDHLRPPRA
ncbi:MAG TPA: hypothetical protein VF306_09430 [Pirellulales bacterium]